MVPNEPSIRQRKSNYYLVFYDGARQPKQKWVPLRTKTKRVAERRAEPLRADYMRGQFNPWTDDPEATVPTAGKAVDTYLEARKGDLSTRTWNTYKYDLEPFGDRFEGQRLDMVPPDQIDDWCRRGDVSNRTVEKRLMEVKRLYNWFIDRGVLSEDPTARLSAPTVHTSPPRFLSRDEYDTLTGVMRAYADAYGTPGAGPPGQQAPRTWVLRGTQLAVSTGLRRRSLIELTWGDIDMTNGRIVVEGGMAKTSGYVVPLFDQAERTLQAIGPRVDEALVLTRHDGSAVPPRMFTRQFNRFAEKAGLGDVSLHTCRHTFASWLVQAGVPLYTVSQWLGHSSIETTERYAHLSPSQNSQTAESVFS